MNTNGRNSLPAALTPDLEELTNIIVGAAFEVGNILGHGFLENVYSKAMVKELALRGVRADKEVRLPVFYKGENVGTYIADLVAERAVIVEFKALEKLVPAHTGQILNYLRASNLRVGLLFNFGQPKVEFKRVLL